MIHASQITKPEERGKARTEVGKKTKMKVPCVIPARASRAASKAALPLPLGKQYYRYAFRTSEVRASHSFTTLRRACVAEIKSAIRSFFTYRKIETKMGERVWSLIKKLL